MNPWPIDHPRYWLRPLPAAAGPDRWLSPLEQAWCRQLPCASRHRYGASRSLMRQLLAPLLGLPAQRVPLHSPPGQAPRLEPGCGHLSLSHSADQVLLGWSPLPIGVDLEWSGRPLAGSALARRFFPEPEVVWLLSLEPEDQRRALLESWVCKEAAVKWQGSSLARDLRHWSWDATQRRLLHLQRGLQPPVVCGERNGWLWAAVGDGVAHGIWS